MNHIQNYFLIGNLHTAALVSKKASIDWLCWPHFDSPSIFARLLDKGGGSFCIENSDIKIKSKYIKDTAIVEHVCQSQGGIFVIRDFMVPHQHKSCHDNLLIRKIVGIKNRSTVNFHFDPKPNYAKDSIIFKKRKLSLTASIKEYRLRLRVPEGSKIIKKESGYTVKVIIEEGREEKILLEYRKGRTGCSYRDDFEVRTRNFWSDWLTKGVFVEFCREQMVRSAITLKLMQYYPTGAIIAAPTSSLPEELGGVRNWDYRYVWIRDATFTLYAFYIMGYREELLRFFDFIENIARDCKNCGDTIRLMYTINGTSVPEEVELRHLHGFKNSSPVRIGNAAFDQFQLDVYGSLIDAYYFMWRRGGLKISKKAQEIIVTLVENIEKVWMKKDEGIWEMRSKKQHFTYSKVMAWVGVNRAIRMSRSLGINKEKRKEWSNLDRAIKHWIWKNCYNEKIESFIQHPDTMSQDATNFLFVLLQFLNRHTKQTKYFIIRTCRELSYKKSFIYRYLVDDSLKGKEGAFVLCTFWMIAALAAVGEIDEAIGHYYNFSGYMDETMLISEEIDPDNGEYLGNFPQAFSHMGLILAAFFINKYREKSGKKDKFIKN